MNLLPKRKKCHKLGHIYFYDIFTQISLHILQFKIDDGVQVRRGAGEELPTGASSISPRQISEC